MNSVEEPLEDLPVHTCCGHEATNGTFLSVILRRVKLRLRTCHLGAFNEHSVKLIYSWQVRLINRQSACCRYVRTK